MKSILQFGLLALLVTFCTSQVFADPIVSHHYKTYSVSWFTSDKTQCYAVCKGHGAAAESMKLSSASTQNMYVCRVQTKTNNEYGSNTSDNCLYYDTLANKPVKAAKFQCLCVKRASILPKLPKLQKN